MKNVRPIIIVVLILAALLAVAYVAFIRTDWFAVDNCLDAGGRWANERGRCEFAAFIPSDRFVREVACTKNS